MKNTNILIAGIGGQGSLLASNVLGELFSSQGLDVKCSEVHGMSQRGGGVITYMRAGEKVYAPIVPKGEADFLIAFEQLEALRWLSHVKPGGKVFMSIQAVPPLPVLTGAAAYPQGIVEEVLAQFPGSLVLDALALARESGSEKTANVVVLGAASNMLPYSVDAWKEALAKCIRPKFHDVNFKAFDVGRSA
jgi:indolepyruvate ferredoxin oxidoreductase beta subunit